jgi:hypothetical protein
MDFEKQHYMNDTRVKTGQREKSQDQNGWIVF